MNCTECRDHVLDALTEVLPSDVAAEVRSHLDACPRCGPWAGDMDDLWRSLGTLAPPVLSPASALRIVGRLGAPRRAPRLLPLGAYAAGLALAFVAGRLAAPAAPSAAVDGPIAEEAPAVPAASGSGAPAEPSWLLLLHETAGMPLVQPGSAREAAVIAEYRAWAGDLADGGRLLAAEKLEGGPGSWLPARVATGPTVVSGFFLIRAADRAEAERIAGASPHVRLGGSVEVRRIDPT